MALGPHPQRHPHAATVHAACARAWRARFPRTRLRRAALAPRSRLQHWVYNVGDITKKVTESASRVPEFQPQAAPWHAARTAGQGTMYGEQLLVTLRALAAHPEHKFTKANFLTQFMAAFGPGGSYIGYAGAPRGGAGRGRVARGAVYHSIPCPSALRPSLAPLPLPLARLLLPLLPPLQTPRPRAPSTTV